MFPPENAMVVASYVRHGVPVEIVWIAGTRVYYPMAADWIEQEVGGVRRRNRRQPSENPCNEQTGRAALIQRHPEFASAGSREEERLNSDA